MKAIKRNLPDLIGSNERVFMFCYECGSTFSANKGDYWDYPDDHTFKCCGQACELVKEKRQVTRWTPGKRETRSNW